MMLKLFNTLTGKKEIFVSASPGVVRMYVCGMTIYDYCHLGHARLVVSFDVIRRWLRTLGYEVVYVRNITDIDDKIIRAAVQSSRRIAEVTEYFIGAMHADCQALGVERPTHEPRATQYVGEMLNIIGKLERDGYAYQSASGDVNYAVRAFSGYGKLSGKSVDDLLPGQRVAANEAKRDPLDFVLWKAAKEQEPSDSKWASPYGFGRPGWHIECSAMAHALLGPTLDIHGGGPDLRFPHHENEIAQSEAAFEQPLARIWMHCGPLMVDREKMSKSLGNFMTIRQAVQQYGGETVRYYLSHSHYRNRQSYAVAHLGEAQASLKRLYQALHSADVLEGEVDWEHPLAQEFRDAMNDDFNTPKAIAILHGMANELNKTGSAALGRLLKGLGGTIGLLQQPPSDFFQAAQLEVPVDLQKRIEARARAKQCGNYAEADRIRAELFAEGIVLEDSAGSETRWKRV